MLTFRVQQTERHFTLSPCVLPTAKARDMIFVLYFMQSCYIYWWLLLSGDMDVLIWKAWQFEGNSSQEFVEGKKILI